jgi:hypothetical protein
MPALQNRHKIYPYNDSTFHKAAFHTGPTCPALVALHFWELAPDLTRRLAAVSIRNQ